MADTGERNAKRGGSIEITEGTESVKGSNTPLGLQLPVDPLVWHQARKLAGDKNIRVEDLAVCAAQDPVMVIDLLKTANALFFTGSKSQITSVKAAIMRLGSDVLIEQLEKLRERQVIESGEVRRWLEIHRSRCRRTGIVARLLAELLARSLNDDCHTSGLLANIGDMLAVAFLKERYVEIAADQPRATVLYRLAQDCRFDVEAMGISYLRRQGLPETLIFALEREGRSRTPDRAIMKPLCQAACEMVDAFDANKWDKLAPGKTLPPKSALRSLQLSEQQYLKVYERASEFLFSSRLTEERAREKGIPKSIDEAAESINSSDNGNSELEAEIQQLISSSKVEEYDDEDDEAPASKAFKPQTILKESAAPTTPADFSLDKATGAKPRVARIKAEPSPEKASAPELASKRGTEIVSAIHSMLNGARSSEEMITKLLDMLIKEGKFEKSALIVVSKDRSKAIVVAARGPNIGNGQKLVIDDPLSPLAQCFSKVQSFGNQESPHSPFGSKTFALSPIDADHETPVALYADCGNSGSISFEARRIFRTVVEILNSRLPEVPGGIPVELKN